MSNIDRDMVINSKDIESVLNGLAMGAVTREDGELWAIERRDALDLGELLFEPPTEKERIWDAIQFMELYAQKLDPNKYLYSIEDLLHYIESNQWKIKMI